MPAAPDHLVHAFPDNTVTAQEQQKFIGNVETVKEAPHAAVGDIDNEAAARWNSGSAPFPRPSPPSRRLLSVSEDDHHSLWSVVPPATGWSAAATYQEMQFSPSVGQLVTKGDCLQQATVAERVAVGLNSNQCLSLSIERFERFKKTEMSQLPGQSLARHHEKRCSYVKNKPRLGNAGFVVRDIQVQATYSNGLTTRDITRLVIDENDFASGQIESPQG